MSWCDRMVFHGIPPEQGLGRQANTETSSEVRAAGWGCCTGQSGAQQRGRDLRSSAAGRESMEYVLSSGKYSCLIHVILSAVLSLADLHIHLFGVLTRIFISPLMINS